MTVDAYKLRIRLLSEATFGRGDGVAGLVDAEIEHDEATGLPYIPGRSLKGLLVEECAELLWAVSRFRPSVGERLAGTARLLFGRPGSGLEDAAGMRVGNAVLPPDLVRAVRAEIAGGALAPADVLASFTHIRRQTAIDDEIGAPARSGLRSIRVLLRETVLAAPLGFDEPPDEDALALLSACALCLRRGGMGRNRGRGRLNVQLLADDGRDLTDIGYTRFADLVQGGSS